MRTARPMKHAPRPLLPLQAKKQKSRRMIEDSTGTGINEVYSYNNGKAKGTRQAARRIGSAKVDVAASRATASVGTRKGKQVSRAGENQASGDDSEDDFENRNSAVHDGEQDLSKIKFRIGMDSDDDETAKTGFEDDEEIDSDLADTDHEEPKPAKAKIAKPISNRLKRTSENDSNQRQLKKVVEIDLDERSDIDDSEDGDGYMDLSEALKDDASSSQFQDSKDASNKKGSTRKLSPFEEKENRGRGSSDDEDEDNDLEEDEEEEEEAEEGTSDGDDDAISADDNREALAKLGNFVEKLPSHTSKRELDEIDCINDVSEEISSKKRRKTTLQKERTEAIPEGEFVAVGSNIGKLTLDDLLSPLSPSQASALKKTLKPLSGLTKTQVSKDSTLAAEVSRLTAGEAALLERERQKQFDSRLQKPLKQSGALPAPLAPLHQAKVERQAAREKLDEHVKKWDETVKVMRGIGKEGADDPESRLVLPLMTQGLGKGTSGAELVAKFAPSNDLEHKIASLISSSGLSLSALIATENSALMDALPTVSNKSASHDADRIAQLRLTRDLMFRAERKARRVAKIKSRTFRKIAKKSRMRQLENGEDGPNSLSTTEMTQLDSIDGGNRMEAERERLETLRAKERATLRHASGASSATAGGRWSKGLRGLDGMDDNVKDAIRQRQSKQELLRQKILGHDEVDDGSEMSDNEAGSEQENEDLQAIQLSAFDELSDLKKQDDESHEAPKGLMGMKFMQRASQKENERIDGLVEDFKMQIEGELGDTISETDDSRKAGKGGDLVQGNPGRMVFRPSVMAESKQAPSDNEQVREGKRHRLRKHNTAGNNSRTSGVITIDSPVSTAATVNLINYNPFTKPSSLSKGEIHNPWLSILPDKTSLHVSRKSNKEVVGTDDKLSGRAAARLKKVQNKNTKALRQIKSDATVNIATEDVFLGNSQASGGQSISSLPATSPTAISKRKNREMAPPPSSSGAHNIDTVFNENDGDDEEASDNDEAAFPEAIVSQQGSQAFTQRDLVAQAFAGDNVIADFENLKQQEIEADAPREEDMTLPGWGTWGGKGVRKQKNAKKIVKQIPGIHASQRKDANLKHVILSEKQDKKAAKYLTKDLPFPYTSKSQYEQKLAQPTGVEWTTRGTHKDMTMPRVLIKPGVLIKPVAQFM